MEKVEAASRESGMTLHTIVQTRNLLGIGRPLLDEIAPEPEWEFTPTK